MSRHATLVWLAASLITSAATGSIAIYLQAAWLLPITALAATVAFMLLSTLGDFPCLGCTKYQDALDEAAAERDLWRKVARKQRERLEKLTGGPVNNAITNIEMDK